uniref:Peptidase S1 domain-containing protein n=1 Tax=Ascaris lumbricoides TaxID=6252 RepID=A0A9J2P8M2_ASCLU
MTRRHHPSMRYRRQLAHLPNFVMQDHRCVLILFVAVVYNASYTTASMRARRMLCGDDVNPGQYPFFANLIVRFPHTAKPLLCGGSLITAETVLTAAHCVYDPVSEQVATYVNITINDYFLMQKERNELLITSSHFDVNHSYKSVGVGSEIVKEGPDLPYDAPVLRVCQESNVLLISSLQTNLAVLLDMLKRRGLASRLMDDQRKCAEEHMMRFKMW